MATATTPTPASTSRLTPAQSQEAANRAAGRARHLANVKKYAFPLPILLSNSNPKGKEPSSSSSLSTYLPFVNSKDKVIFPECIGTFDHSTRSIWITDPTSAKILFERGFFGKGSLSRSEPTWKSRRVDLIKGGEGAAAEQLREKRRVERKKFKIDRAQAMLDAAKQAEAVLTSATATKRVALQEQGQGGGVELEEEDEEEEELDNRQEGDSNRPDSPTPSTSTTTTTTTTIIDPLTLTPQTFLVRPTRPDTNRNRGKKAFRRRPPPAPAPAAIGITEQSQTIPVPVSAPVVEEEEDEDEDDGESDFDESLIEDMEHLQLCLEEAVFLSLGLGVLKIFDPISETYPIGSELLSLLLTPSSSPSPSSPTVLTPKPILKTNSIPLLPDDPLLVSYIAYHHYRSLGWVVKHGIKFCADWLLYRKGPAFSHSAFACLMIPVYSDPNDQINSPHGKTDWYEERITWKWINTVMRVNSLVQKTVIAVYITIPSLESFSSNLKLNDGSLDPETVDFASLLKRYTIREVSLTRFGPARRRD